MSGLGIRRNPEESWLDAALRYAAPWGLEEEVQSAYELMVREGATEPQAALWACMDWDVALLPGDPPGTSYVQHVNGDPFDEDDALRGPWREDTEPDGALDPSQ